MFARVVEVMLACWLAMSPFIFRYSPEATLQWANDWVCAALIVVFSTLSYWRPTKHIHLANAVLAIWMLGVARLSALPPALLSSGYQNLMIVGLLLGMFAIIPNWSFEPPAAWWSDRDAMGAGD